MRIFLIFFDHRLFLDHRCYHYSYVNYSYNTTKIKIRIPEELANELDIDAQAQKIPLSHLCCHLITPRDAQRVH
jgi:hypothetical protein